VFWYCNYVFTICPLGLISVVLRFQAVLFASTSVTYGTGSPPDGRPPSVQRYETAGAVHAALTGPMMLLEAELSVSSWPMCFETKSGCLGEVLCGHW
jgi:hypothetical protein